MNDYSFMFLLFIFAIFFGYCSNAKSLDESELARKIVRDWDEGTCLSNFLILIMLWISFCLYFQLLIWLICW